LEFIYVELSKIRMRYLFNHFPPLPYIILPGILIPLPLPAPLPIPGGGFEVPSSLPAA
jgi:hypothetical protein